MTDDDRAQVREVSSIRDGIDGAFADSRHLVIALQPEDQLLSGQKQSLEPEQEVEDEHARTRATDRTERSPSDARGQQQPLTPIEEDDQPTFAMSQDSNMVSVVSRPVSVSYKRTGADPTPRSLLSDSHTTPPPSRLTMERTILRVVLRQVFVPLLFRSRHQPEL